MYWWRLWIVTGISRPWRRNSIFGYPGRTKSRPKSAMGQPSRSNASICSGKKIIIISFTSLSHFCLISHLFSLFHSVECGIGLNDFTLLDDFIKSQQMSLNFGSNLTQVSETERMLLGEQPAVECGREGQIQLIKKKKLWIKMFNNYSTFSLDNSPFCYPSQPLP